MCVCRVEVSPPCQSHVGVSLQPHHGSIQVDCRWVELVAGGAGWCVRWVGLVDDGRGWWKVGGAGWWVAGRWSWLQVGLVGGL